MSVVLSLILLVGINQIYVDHVLEHKELPRTQKQFLQMENKGGVSELFLGNSQVRDGFNPLVMDGSFNFATSAQTIVESYFILKYADSIYHLETVYLQFDLYPMYGTADGSIKVQEGHYFSNIIPIENISSVNQVSNLEVLIRRSFPVLGNGGDFLNMIFPSRRSTMIRGWTPKDRSSPGDVISKEAKRKAEERFGQPSGLNSEYLFYFGEIVKYCQKNEIEIILFSTPLPHNYVSKVDYLVPERREILYSVKGDHDLVWIDFYREFNLEEYDAYFFDGNHLNLNGSLEWSSKFGIDSAVYTSYYDLGLI